MEGFLHVPYINTDFDEGKFDYGGNIDYVSNLNNVGRNIVGYSGFEQYTQNKNRYGNSVGFGNQNINKVEVLSEQLSYYDLPVVLYDIDDNKMSIDCLLDYFKTSDSFMLKFSFDCDNSDEDCLIELKSWVSESNKVMNLPDNEYSEELKMELLPKRTFKFSTEKNKSYLEDCLFFDSYDDKIVMFVKKIIFYN